MNRFQKPPKTKPTRKRVTTNQVTNNTAGTYPILSMLVLVVLAFFVGKHSDFSWLKWDKILPIPTPIIIDDKPLFEVDKPYLLIAYQTETNYPDNIEEIVSGSGPSSIRAFCRDKGIEVRFLDYDHLEPEQIKETDETWKRAAAALTKESAGKSPWFVFANKTKGVSGSLPENTQKLTELITSKL